MKYIIVIVVAYLIGSSSMSYYLGKLNGVELKKMGSKNLGASNTMALLGWKAGIIVGLHDILKAIVAVMLLKYIFPDLQYVKEVAGVSCIIGHIFPFYLNFKGGKGFASYIGMTIALDWKFAIAIVIIIVLVTIITDYIVSGTFSTIILVPVYTAVIHHNLIAAAILVIASVVILYKHKENIHRLLNGTEFGFRSANKGEHRVKK